MRSFISIYRRLLLTFSLFLIGGILVTIYSQHNMTFSQFMLYKEVINPAVCGANSQTTVSLMTRQQWVGVAGSPRIGALSFYSRLPENVSLSSLYKQKHRSFRNRLGPIGVGAYMYSDKVGPISKTGFNANYAYHIDMGENQLSFGLAVVLLQFKVDGSELIFSDDATEPMIGDDMNLSYMNLDANFGIYFSGENYFMGYSASQLFNSAAKFGVNGEGSNKINRTHSIIAGYSYELNRDVSVQPNLFMQLPEDLNSRLAIGADLLYLKQYSVGLSYKTGSALSFHAGVAVDRYKVGYAFDYNFSDMMTGTYGSHEIYLGIRLSGN